MTFIPGFFAAWVVRKIEHLLEFFVAHVLAEGVQNIRTFSVEQLGVTPGVVRVAAESGGAVDAGELAALVGIGLPLPKLDVGLGLVLGSLRHEEIGQVLGKGLGKPVVVGRSPAQEIAEPLVGDLVGVAAVLTLGRITLDDGVEIAGIAAQRAQSLRR